MFSPAGEKGQIASQWVVKEVSFTSFFVNCLQSGIRNYSTSTGDAFPCLALFMYLGSLVTQPLALSVSQFSCPALER